MNTYQKKQSRWMRQWKRDIWCWQQQKKLKKKRERDVVFGFWFFVDINLKRKKGKKKSRKRMRKIDVFSLGMFVNLFWTFCLEKKKLCSYRHKIKKLFLCFEKFFSCVLSCLLIVENKVITKDDSLFFIFFCLLFFWLGLLSFTW